ncbi:23S rRNA pseudouridine955/2504/2580 synthase [Breznakia sp. PF5-3]|uniref:RluA family pseudouridine synthase n=1 Tax=unclassified Breznakia TaxID=2623764 RepID=UPI002406F91B|nr:MULTISPECIES: RluA family pseudouridine synthase [unclassified Breznakia]MDF9824139.1 23S rRNA pseudouridine955/2504/2580 synthase [Breznakia sp. PM6-1]MDF9834937.1 23S rRNA pseudouridine955/2504/2580 synthase [Breznakia sp. PF5-3]MDF9837194.1 23S rRNA pseudouridine955/2504/2580 synthase [Breznakia sp. PFB2-8]MDF9859184.1 23S rRNA pseudouridine955/2504/2580 synthase [Breznakia sp. PH5-24]
MQTIHVYENDANQRVDKFLQKALPKLPKSLMYKYIRNKKIKVNGKRCKPEQKLCNGDIFSCYIAEEFFETKKDMTFLKAKSELQVIYEDTNILIMNKPVGLLVHSDQNEDIDTLINRMKKYLHEKGEYNPESEQSFAPALAHRIDRNTQGLVIGAKNAESLRNINLLIKERRLDKFYLALIKGIPNKNADTWIHYHKKENQKIIIRDIEEVGYKQMKTKYHVLKTKQDISLVEIELFSGRAHQIRAQFAHMGFPLLGDLRYGSTHTDFQYQALCAYKLVFHSSNNDYFSYLDGKEITLNRILLLDYFNQQ